MPEIAWPQSSINSKWGNAQDPESLLDFLSSELESGRPADKLYVHQETDLTKSNDSNIGQNLAYGPKLLWAISFSLQLIDYSLRIQS